MKSKNILSVLLFFFVAHCFSQTTYYVNDNSLTNDVYTTAIGNNGNSGLTTALPKLTLGNALSAASAGDIIMVDTGEYDETNVDFNKEITVIGAGAGYTLFSNFTANDRFGIVSANNVTIQGVTVSQFFPQLEGQAFFVNSNITGFLLVNSVVKNNPGATTGGSNMFLSPGSETTITGMIDSCSGYNGSGGGGIKVNGATLVVSNSFFRRSRNSSGEGGAMQIYGTNPHVTITDCTFTENSGWAGGAIAQFSGTLIVSGSCFDKNYIQGDGSDPTNGGGHYYAKGAITLATFTNCSFEDAFFCAGDLSVMDPTGELCQFSTNSSNDGKGISLQDASGTFSWDTCYFSNRNGTTVDDGQDFHLEESGSLSVTINNCTFGNDGPDSGSAERNNIFNQDLETGDLTITNCGVRIDNPADNQDGIDGNNYSLDGTTPGTENSLLPSGLPSTPFCVDLTGLLDCDDSVAADCATETEDPRILKCVVDKTIVGCPTSPLLDYTSEVIAFDDCSFVITQSPVAGTILPGGTNIITITVTDTSGNTDTCTFEVDVEICSTCSATTTWNGSSWNNNNPDIDTNVVISGNYDTTTHGSFSACNLQVDYNNRLTVRNSTYAEVQNDITIDGEIWVETLGSLVQNENDATVTVNNVDVADIPALVTKFTQPLQKWYDYTYWSSPVANETIGVALATANASRRFKFNASLYNDTMAEILNTGTFTNDVMDDIDDDGDAWIVAGSSETMMPGVGYAATHTPIGFMVGASYAYPFKGVFNTGNIPVQIYVTPVGHDTVDYNSWNLIGNPYPSAINVDDFFATNNSLIEEAIYLWSHNTALNADAPGNDGQNFASADYAIINKLTVVAGSDGIDPDRYISTGQGFFVAGNKSAVINAGYVTANFNNDMRHLDNSIQFFRTSTSNNSDRNEFRLLLTSNNGVSNQLYIGYVDDATNGFDGYRYDAVRNLGSNQSAMLYSIINNHVGKFAIQGRNENLLDLDEIIPLGFKNLIPDNTTEFTISIKGFNGDFISNNTIYLKDNLLNIIHDLSSTDYNFTSDVEEYNSRFEIVFRNNTLSVSSNDLDSSSLLIIDKGLGLAEFIVPNQYKIKTVKVYDLVGKLVYDLVGNSNTETYNLSSLSSATYFAKVELEDSRIITKKFIKE